MPWPSEFTRIAWPVSLNKLIWSVSEQPAIARTAPDVIKVADVTFIAASS